MLLPVKSYLKVYIINLIVIFVPSVLVLFFCRLENNLQDLMNND